MSALLRSRVRVLPKTNRVFLYSVRIYPNQPARAAIATISPFGFQVGSASFLGDWTSVTGAATANRKWLLLHDRRTGSLATAWVDRDLILHTAKTYLLGAINYPFHTAGVDGRGCLALLGGGGPDPLLLGFAQVLDDGTFVEWWRTPRSDLRLADGPIVGLTDTHAWFSNDRAGSGSTLFLVDVKRGQIMGSRRWSASIQWMVGEGNLLFLYLNDRLRTTELCAVDENYRIVTLKRTELDFDAWPDGFDRIASTPGAHLQYAQQAYGAFGSIRVLSRDGFKLTTKLSGMDWRWHYFVPC